MLRRAYTYKKSKISAATASRSSSRTTSIHHVVLDIAGRLLSWSGTEAIMGLVTPGGRGFPSKSILGNSGHRAGVPSGAPTPHKKVWTLGVSGKICFAAAFSAAVAAASR